MPKYYCEYCDIFLTHDSSSVRKAHNSGKNHIANVRNYYAEIGQDKAQAIIDDITKAYEKSAAGKNKRNKVLLINYHNHS
ncbi:U1 zinc finger-domain-containing protein [Circinella umbellata]|nr:U1 zinc finger-domain-containing protein [Circinella umbellata]